MKRIEFDGGYLDVREPHEVTNQGRRAVRAMMTSVAGPMNQYVTAKDEYLTGLNLPDGQEPTEEQLNAANLHATVTCDLTEDKWDRMQQLFDASLVAAVAGWSLTTPLGQPLPVSRDSLNNLPADQYDVVANAGRPFAEAISANLSVDFSLQTLDPSTPDPTGA